MLAALIEQKISSMFGYPKVNLIIGSDHGAGSSKCLFCANLMLPKQMCQLDNIESSVVHQFLNLQTSPVKRTVEMWYHLSIRK